MVGDHHRRARLEHRVERRRETLRQTDALAEVAGRTGRSGGEIDAQPALRAQAAGLGVGAPGGGCNMVYTARTSGVSGSLMCTAACPISMPLRYTYIF